MGEFGERAGLPCVDLEVLWEASGCEFVEPCICWLGTSKTLGYWVRLGGRNEKWKDSCLPVKSMVLVEES